MDGGWLCQEFGAIQKQWAAESKLLADVSRALREEDPTLLEKCIEEVPLPSPMALVHDDGMAGAVFFNDSRVLFFLPGKEDAVPLGRDH